MAPAGFYSIKLLSEMLYYNYKFSRQKVITKHGIPDEYHWSGQHIHWEVYNLRSLLISRFNYIKDSKLRNFATIVVKNEDHTLGNTVRMYGKLANKSLLLIGSSSRTLMSGLPGTESHTLWKTSLKSRCKLMAQKPQLWLWLNHARKQLIMSLLCKIVLQ